MDPLVWDPRAFPLDLRRRGQSPLWGITASIYHPAGLAVAFVPVSSIGLLVILAYCGVLGFSLFAIEPFYLSV
ncbi:hypothetical protein ACYJ1Y_02880 [Natrialbaceae archaeon A-gly3]